MPRVIPKRARWRDDQIVVAWASLAAEQYVIRKGERLRGSDPRVVAHPDVFVEDGTPQSEWRSPGTGMRRSDHGKASDPKEPPEPSRGKPHRVAAAATADHRERPRLLSRAGPRQRQGQVDATVREK